MTYLRISIFLFVLCSSCSLKTVSGLAPLNLDKTKVYNPYFDQSSIDYVYRAKIQLFGNDLSGLLIIKKLENSHRIALTTEFGNKIFDFELKEDAFRIIHIEEKMNKKVVIRTLQKDFQLLVRSYTDVVNSYKSVNTNIYQHKAEKNNEFFFYNVAGDLEKIIGTSKFKEKVSIEFVKFTDSNIKNPIAKRIKINHQNFNLSIDLNFLKSD